jgi:general secretion pathway protein C
MSVTSQSRWWVGGATFLVWALTASGMVYWGLKLWPASGAATQAPVATAVPAAVSDPAALARALGAGAAPAAAVEVNALSRFSLVGVIAGQSSQGAALIALDGKPAKPYRVGQKLDESLWLQSVSARQAVLAASPGGPALYTLEMPLRRAK